MDGLVTKSTGSWYEVLSSSGKQMRCRVRGKLRLKGIMVTNPVAVGDWVSFDMEGNTDQGIIHNVRERKNYLIRRSTRKAKYGHILAANIDLAILMATVSLPRTSLGFIDRFLVAAESFRIPSLLVFNKSDLWDREITDQVEVLRPVYEKIGVKFLCISAETGENLSKFKQLIGGRLSLIAGHSGVGKSTILNRLSPEINQKTGEVSTFANKGIHTTTFAEMFDLGNGTRIIDTPGIKELGLMDIYDEEISHFFPEMREYFGQCKFYNCTHLHEPGCAVIRAVEAGKIAPSRFYSYLSMMEEEDTHR